MIEKALKDMGATDIKCLYQDMNYCFTYKGKYFQIKTNKEGTYSVYWECLLLATRCTLDIALNKVKRLYK